MKKWAIAETLTLKIIDMSEDIKIQEIKEFPLSIFTIKTKKSIKDSNFKEEFEFYQHMRSTTEEGDTHEIVLSFIAKGLW